MENSKPKMNSKAKGSQIASKIPTSGRDSGTHSRSSSVSNLTTASDIHSEIGDGSENYEDFKVGEQVWVSGTKSGVIKFIGKTQFAPGVWAGVLLDEPVGKNDGSVAGVQYFKCEPLRGIFTRLNKLSRTASPFGGDAPSQGTVTPKPNLSSSRLSVCSNISSTSPSTKLKVGDRVTVSSLGGLKPGTLRFIGETEFAKGEWAGIELDEPTGKNDGSVAGKRYFTCQMKYGLFAPLHKVSRAAVTPSSKSARGTTMIRSGSRDSLNSSVSTSSRASRVKLGVMSLSSAQKLKGSTSTVTSSKALQEALKEKEQHIEQLLKERDIDRAEFARISSHFEEVSAQLGQKQKKTESDKRNFEEELNVVQKKLEDVQFQLEEERIMKSDLETKLEQVSSVLKRIEDFISKDKEAKYLNIQEILSGQETLSDLSEKSNSEDHKEVLSSKVTELETSLKCASEEKEEIMKKIIELQTCSANYLAEIESLKTTVFEKEDMISNLKFELGNSIEKITNLLEENKQLSEQIRLKEEEAKGHANDVINELGEKIKLLEEEIKVQNKKINEYQSSNQEKDDLISSLQENANVQATLLSQLETEIKELNEKLKIKELELKDKMASQTSIEEQMQILISQNDKVVNERDQKIKLLEEEIKIQCNKLNEYQSSNQEKDGLISSLQENANVQATLLSQLETEIKELNEKLKIKDLELKDKIASQTAIEEQMQILKTQNDKAINEKDQKLLDQVKEIERLTNNIQEKEDHLFKVQHELISSKSDIDRLNETIQQLMEKIQDADLNLSTITKDTSEKITQLEKEISILKQEKEEILSSNETKMALYDEDIKAKLDQLNQYQLSIQEKDNLISSLQQSSESQASILLQLQIEVKELNEKLKAKELELNEKLASQKSLEEQMNILKSQSESTVGEKEQKLMELVKEIESLTNCLHEKEDKLVKTQNELILTKQELEKLNEVVKHLEEKIVKSEHSLSDITSNKNETINALENEIKILKQDKDEITAENETKTQILQDEINTKCNLINEYQTSIQEKDNLISSMQEKAIAQEAILSQIQTEVTKLGEKLKAKETELNEKIASQTSLEEQINILKLQNESSICEKEQKLLSQVKEIECLNSSLQDKENQLQKSQNELISSKEEIERLNEAIQQLTRQRQEADLALSSINEVTTEKLTMLQNEISVLKQEKDKITSDYEKEMEDLKNTTKNMEEELKAKNDAILQNETLSISLKEKLMKSEEKCSSLENDLSLSAKQTEDIFEEVKSLKKSLEENEKLMASYKNEIENLKNCAEKSAENLELKDKDIKELQNSLKLKEEENIQLSSKLKFAEEKIDILHKDSNEHIVLLESELLKIKDVDIKVNNDLQQMTQSMEAKEKELKALQNILNLKDEENSQLCSKLQMAEEQINMLSSNSSEQVTSLQKEISELKGENITAKNDLKQVQIQLDEFKKSNEEKSEMILTLEDRISSLEELLENNKNLCMQREEELSLLKNTLQKPQNDFSDDNIELLKEEIISLKNKIAHFELVNSDKNSASPVKITSDQPSEYAEERESLLSQIDFLNSIIVDLKHKNEKLEKEKELQLTCWDTNDLNISDTKKVVAPRLFCDICDMFDLHETCDCPKQESFIGDESPILQRQKPGTRQLEERPYCNQCEVFGHWTADCEEPDTF